MKLKELFEAPIDDVETDLRSVGYQDFIRRSGKTLAVLTDKNRAKVIDDIVTKLPGAEYDETPNPKSSMGLIKDPRGVSIMVKPKGRQGAGSAGVGNEAMLVEKINQIASKKNPITVTFDDSETTYSIENVIEAKGVGTSTKGRKKADVVLYTADGQSYNFSIKKDNAEMWESADSFWGDTAAKYVKKLDELGKIELKQEKSGHFTITPNVAVEATAEEAKDVVFGSDILGNGAVITKTFRDGDFSLDERTLTVKCSNIISDFSEIPEDKYVWFLIRNDKTRAGAFKGLRVVAVYEKRLNPKILRVRRKAGKEHM